LHVPFVPQEAAPASAHVVAQQIPITQWPFAHCVSTVHTPPLGFGATHLPLLSQTAPPLSVHGVATGAGVVPQQPSMHVGLRHAVAGAGHAEGVAHDAPPSQEPATPPMPPPELPLVDIIPPVPVVACPPVPVDVDPLLLVLPPELALVDVIPLLPVVACPPVPVDVDPLLLVLPPPAPLELVWKFRPLEEPQPPAPMVSAPQARTNVNRIREFIIQLPGAW
jgi:hypothetical protein